MQLLPEAFAVVREAALRTLKMRHFDVQLIGGIALHQGKIAEMRTGEGKTLVATLPAYLNALTGKGVHVVTVNEYLAQRDADWMGPVYRFLGLSGRGDQELPELRRRSATPTAATSPTAPTTSSASTTCATTSRYRLEDRVQRGLVLRDRRRGRLDPDRRGAHAAHHLGTCRGEHRAVRARQRARAAPDPAEGQGRGGPGRLQRRREDQAGAPHRGRPRARRGAHAAIRAPQGGREPLRPGEHPPDASPERGTARARALQARRRVHRARRRGDHRRRVHRPHDARTTLVRRPAPGGRGQGGRAGTRREPDGRLDHVPELLPPLQEALRHDRHGRHRGATSSSRSTGSRWW